MFVGGPRAAVRLERQGAKHDNRQLLLGLRVHRAARRAAGRAGGISTCVRILHADSGPRHSPHPGLRATQLHRGRHLARHPRIHACECLSSYYLSLD